MATPSDCNTRLKIITLFYFLFLIFQVNTRFQLLAHRELFKNVQGNVAMLAKIITTLLLILSVVRNIKFEVQLNFQAR